MLMLNFHFNFALQLIVLVLGAAIIVWSKIHKDVGTSLAKAIGYIVIILAVFNILCISYYAMQYRSLGFFGRSHMIMQCPMMQGQMMPKQMMMNREMMQEKMMSGQMMNKDMMQGQMMNKEMPQQGSAKPEVMMKDQTMPSSQMMQKQMPTKDENKTSQTSNY